MRFFDSLAVALAMYSKIPVPTVDWNEKNMKYAMCFFPVAGVVTGALEYAAGYALLTWTDCGSLFFAAVMTLIPVLVTGESIWTALRIPWMRSAHTETGRKSWRY